MLGTWLGCSLEGPSRANRAASTLPRTQARGLQEESCTVEDRRRFGQDSGKYGHRCDTTCVSGPSFPKIEVGAALCQIRIFLLVERKWNIYIVRHIGSTMLVLVS